ECGLRCVYHGWKFDTQGNCVDMPSEPPYSKFRLRVSIKAYPTYEAGGIVFAYLGPVREMPAPPDYEWMRAPASHLGVSKTGEHCNYLQAIEGGIDTAHISFAHNNDLSNTRALSRMDTHPELEVDDHPWGFTYAGIRTVADDTQYVRVYQFVMPNQQMRPTILNGSKGLTGERNACPTLNGHMWVPIDDENVCVYNLKYTIDDAVGFTAEEFARGEHAAGRGPEDYIPGTYWLRSNKSNDYKIDREVQRTKTFTGIHGVNTQDFALQSALGGGYIVDRSKEALGSTDRAIQACRRLLLEAADDVEAGRPLRGSDPEAYRHIRSSEALIPRGVPWRDATKEIVQAFW
ncbi:MAG TPA: Rieske 2Fe-2S domain-containing protein, partial [Acidimicrobiales bacterium]|nr:Rieske 2Fe-2S domain-containing protein [Acidimicrobiales bacterium]